MVGKLIRAIGGQKLLLVQLRGAAAQAGHCWLQPDGGAGPRALSAAAGAP